VVQVPCSVVSALLLLHCGLSSTELASQSKAPPRMWSAKRGITVGANAVVRWPVGESGTASWSEGVVLGVEMVRCVAHPPTHTLSIPRPPSRRQAGLKDVGSLEGCVCMCV
jgi:hypothetical protein